jgi:hypothetical protein
MVEESSTSLTAVVRTKKKEPANRELSEKLTF